MNYLGFDIGIAKLTTYDDDKFLGVQIDAFGEEKSGVVPYEAHSPHGFISRCHDGDDAGSCTVLYAMEAGRGHAWIMGDPRIIPLLPPINKGGAAVYGGKLKAPSFFFIDGDTNSQTFYVPYKIDADGVAAKSMTIEINVDNEGEESISIVHGSGAAFIIMESDGEVSVTLKNQAGDAYIEVNDKGIILNGAVTVQGGFNAGGPATAQPLVMGPPLVALLEQLIKIVGAIVGNAGTTGAPANALSGQLAGLLALNTKGL